MCCLMIKEKEIIKITLLCSTNLLHLLYIILIEKIMARPIGETPVLYGEDAVRFLKEMENVKPATDEEKDRVRKAYELMKDIATFSI